MAVFSILATARPARAADTLVVKWSDVLLQAIRSGALGPPMTARAIGIVYTCGFDAWAIYDHEALGTRLGGTLRRPHGERTAANRETAFSYGVYRCLLDLYPAQSAYLRSQMTALGYDPDNATNDKTVPEGAGNVAAAAVLEYRHHDGSNQLGDLHAGAYSDYTGYVPINDLDHIIDPNRWQPLRFSDGHGGMVTPGCVGPYWGRVFPFALSSSSQFRPGPPQRYPANGYTNQAQAVLDLNVNLDDRAKMIAEYWANGPHSELPPGHWTLFAQLVSRRDHHKFDEDVKMFFLLGNALLDAGIAAWEAKSAYDSERPITAIRYLNKGKKIRAYVPRVGVQLIDGENWVPFQPDTFITPPFAEYISGHSAFSAAAAEILRRFTHSDHFGGSVTLPTGSSAVEPGMTPAHDVTLSWHTFSDAADEAGISRRYGGIHFEEGDLRSRNVGRHVAAVVWEHGQHYIEGDKDEEERDERARDEKAKDEKAKDERHCDD